MDDELDDLLPGEEEEEREVWQAEQMRLECLRQDARTALLTLAKPGTTIYGIFRKEWDRTQMSFTLFVVIDQGKEGKPTPVNVSTLVAQFLGFRLFHGDLLTDWMADPLLEITAQLSRELYGDIRPQFSTQWF